jgi:hypothetical protein
MLNNGKHTPGVSTPMKSYLVLLIFLSLSSTMVRAQKADPKHLLEEASFYADVMVNASADEHRARAHDNLDQAMDSLLALPSSYAIVLDSIRWLSVLHGDGFRVVTWQWKVNADEYKYGGFIQWPDRLVSLKDTRPFVNGSSFNTYTANAWYGALYYQIIPFQREGKDYYMLLGFNGENSQINTKVADVLDLTTKDIKFGVPVFVGQDEPMTRILVSYADVSTVHIRYDKDLGGIIYDHVENLLGVGENGESMPVADGSLEGWILQKGDWTYQEKVFDIKMDTPPMTDERKEKKEDKDILGRPKKQ